MSSKLAKEITRATRLTIFILILLFTGTALPADILTTEKRVVIDPGHSTAAQGLTTINGINESRIVLEFSKLVAQELSGEFQVRLTREQDSETQPDALRPENRTAFANQARADLFISIHLHRDKSPGIHIFYFALPDTPQSSPWQIQAAQNSPNSKKFAAAAAGRFKKALSIPARTYPAPIIPLQGLLMPAILIEPFSTAQVPAAPKERTAFMRPYAKAIASATIAYFKLSDGS